MQERGQLSAASHSAHSEKKHCSTHLILLQISYSLECTLRYLLRHGHITDLQVTQTRSSRSYGLLKSMASPTFRYYAKIHLGQYSLTSQQ